MTKPRDPTFGIFRQPIRRSSKQSRIEALKPHFSRGSILVPEFIRDPSPVTPDDIRELQAYKPPLVSGAKLEIVSKQYKKAEEQAMLDHKMLITMQSAHRMPFGRDFFSPTLSHRPHLTIIDDITKWDDFKTPTQRRPKMEPINIRPVLNGWLVKIGCAEVVFTDKRLMLKEIGRYIADPATVEKEYLKNDKNPNRESTR